MANSWGETVKALKLDSASIVFGWIAGTIVVLLALKYLGSADASQDELIARAALAVAAILAIPLVLLWNFIRMPARMHFDLRDWTKDLEKAILDQERKDEGTAILSAKYAEGIGLWKQQEVEALKTWEEGLDKYIKENFEPGFFHSVCVIDTLDYTTIEDRRGTRVEFSDEYTNRLRYFAEKLRRLSSNIPHCDNYFRGRAILDLNWQKSRVRQYGLSEHRRAE